MMNCWRIVICCVFLALRLTSSRKVIIKDTDFSEISLNEYRPYAVHGTGELWRESGDSVQVCANGNDVETWLVTPSFIAPTTLRNVKIHVEIEARVSPCLPKKCFQDGFGLYRYNGQGKPNVPSDARLTGQQNKEKAKAYFRANFIPIGNITGNSTKRERVNTTFILREKEFRGITFGIQSLGSCGDVYRMKVYYYICKTTFIESVMFNETIAPVNGSKTVFGNCSADSSPHKSQDVLKAYCHSNGTWSTPGDMAGCSCNEGYESITDHGCLSCKENSYKPKISNEKCKKCPKNTKSLRNKTTCTCTTGHHRLPGNLQAENPSRCYAPANIKGKLEVSVDKGNANITWEPPENDTGINETIFYDIQCKICAAGTGACNETCKGVEYSPGQHNITQTFVRLSGLVGGNTYMFRIFPKNSLNNVVPRNEWKFKDTKRFLVKKEGKQKQIAEEDGFPYIVIIICVASLSLLLFVFLIAFLLRRRKEKKGLFQGLSNGVELPTTGKKTYVDPTNYDRPEDAIVDFATEIDASLLFLEMFIGGGEFGDVYKGSMTVADGKKVPIAVKTLKKDATAKSEKDFLLEASVMGQFDCPNVIKLVGVVTKYRPWMIVIEFMSNGSLDNFLKANDGRLSHLELINMAKGVAIGMEYLAGMNFVHRDLAARNVLVDGNLVCKVCDFGLSRELEATDSSRGEYATTGGRIPIRWTAPEATKYRKFSSASDVWSFGILLWEIMSFAERPYWEWDNFRVMEEVDKGFRLPAPLNCPKGVHDLMMQCWKENRVERPNFTEINGVLDGWIQSPKTMEGDVDLSAALREWLESIKMADYVSNFVIGGYQRPCELYGIKEEDLKEIGISLVGHRNKILKGIRNLAGYKKGKKALEREISLEV